MKEYLIRSFHEMSNEKPDVDEAAKDTKLA